jgi:cell division protein FtsQ
MTRAAGKPASPADDLRARTAERTRRNTQRAAQKANRRRSWPRWTGKALRAGMVVLPLVLVGGAVAWAWRDGAFPRLMEGAGSMLVHASMDAGLVVREVMVDGRAETDADKLMRALDVVRGSPIMAFDPDRARTEIERLPWVATATIERRLPDTIFVRLTERKPMALWQNEGKLSLIDVDGVILTERDLGRYPNLPILVGNDAPEHGAGLIERLDAVPELKKKIESAVRVGSRRWDLHMKNGVVVRLPEGDVSGALAKLADLESKHPLLDRDVIAIDLRLPDRLVVQTSAAAAKLRREPEEKI